MNSAVSRTHAIDRLSLKTDVVIVNWNAGNLLRDCVAMLDASDHAENLYVVVVDNASIDGSATGLSGDRIELNVIVNKINRGFGAACNQGAAAGDAPSILFLNPDVRVSPAAIERATAYLQNPKNDRVGIVGVQLRDPDGNITRSCARRPTTTALLLQAMLLDRIIGPPMSHFMAEWDHKSTRKVDQVSGALLLIRRSLFNRLGGFDQRYFMYYEDLDLCVRALDASADVVYYSEVSCEHLGGGTTNAIRGRRLYYTFRSRLEYAVKHHGRAVALMILALIFAVEIPVRLLQSLFGFGLTSAADIVEASASLLHDVPTILRRVFARE